MFQTKVVCYTAVREERPSDGRLVHRQIRYNTVRSNNIFLQCHGVESSLWLRTRLDATISRAPVNVQASIKDGTVFSHHCVFAQARKKRLRNASCGRGVLFENGGKMIVFKQKTARRRFYRQKQGNNNSFDTYFLTMFLTGGSN